MDLGVDPATLYAPGCQTDLTLVLQDSHGHTAYTFSAVRPILAAWSPVIKQALECDSHAPGPGGSHADAAEDPLHHSCAGQHSQLPLTITGSKEAEAWAVALCLMHPLSPTAGSSPASLITTSLLQPLVALADKYDMGGLLPVIKDVLLDPRAVWGVRSVSSGSFLDALEWLAVAERVPGFEPVVARCIKEVVTSCTLPGGRLSRSTASFDAPRYRGAKALSTALVGLRPDTAARLATSLASCLSVAAEQLASSGAGQERYSFRPVGESGGWDYSYDAGRK